MEFLTYQQWDLLADAYIPVMGVIAVVTAVNRARQKHRNGLFLCVSPLVLSLDFVYVLMGIDRFWNLWPRMGLDYSTHLAVAMALVAFLAKTRPNGRAPLASSLVLYALLMIYQAYHTAFDLVATAIPI